LGQISPKLPRMGKVRVGLPATDEWGSRMLREHQNRPRIPYNQATDATAKNETYRGHEPTGKELGGGEQNCGLIGFRVRKRFQECTVQGQTRKVKKKKKRNVCKGGPYKK